MGVRKIHMAGRTKRGYKKQTNAKKVKRKGNIFKSGLELTMYEMLKAANIPFNYEGQKFVIDEGFTHRGESFEKFMNGKGEFKNRGGKRYNNSVYTPDFTSPVDEKLVWVIETKGRAMPDFSRTWRLFKKLMNSLDQDVLLFVPRTKKDCSAVIEILKDRGYAK